jgi:hypothetical protein
LTTIRPAISTKPAPASRLLRDAARPGGTRTDWPWWHGRSTRSFGPGENSYLSRLHWAHGELLPYANASAAEAGEQALRQALSVAREQDVKGWQLSAATSLARLLAEQGRRVEARISSRRYEGQKRRKRCIQMRAEQSVPLPRRSQLSVSTALRAPASGPTLPRISERVIMTSATVGHPGNVQFDLGMPAHLMTDAPRGFRKL